MEENHLEAAENGEIERALLSLSTVELGMFPDPVLPDAGPHRRVAR